QWHQLALFDRVPSADLDLQFDNQGRRVFGGRFPSILNDATAGGLTFGGPPLTNWGRGGGGGAPGGMFRGGDLPVRVWGPRGIQHRLVNYTEIYTDLAHTNPPDTGSAGVQGPLRRNFNEIISTHPNYIAGIPTVVFTSQCTPRGVNEPGSTQEPAGISLL